MNRENKPALTWQDIAQHDSYLAGAVACRGHEWWEEPTAESEADSVHLTGERRVDFLRGWQEELVVQEQERQGQLVRDYDEMSAGWERGDPAHRRY